MKKLLTLLTIFIFHQTYAQEPFVCAYNGYQTVEKVGAACDYVGAEINFGSDASSAEQYVDKILDNIGLFRNFYVEECVDINNAYAVTLPQEGGAVERYILYDEAFFDKVKQSTSGNWGLISILAHEVGHHLNGHTLTGKGSNHQTELQADEFSGFVLARMKCSLEDAQAAISKMLPDKASSTHPAKADRLAAVEKGWNRGNGKTIKVKKITQDIKNKILSGKEDDEDVKNITAEQILANYIDAIGGQEKIKSIKTLKKDYTSTTKMSIMKTTQKVSQSFLTPTVYTVDTKIGKRGKSSKKLTIDGKQYEKKKNSSKWTYIGIVEENKEKYGSYIFEYLDLVNGTKIEYKGIEKIKNNRYYVLQFPKVKDAFEMNISQVKMKCDITEKKYFSVKTGLLYKVERSMHCDFRKKGFNMNQIAYYSDYREVEGVLFPFKVEIKEGEKSKSKQIMMPNVETNYTNIEINPPLNPEDFKVN